MNRLSQIACSIAAGAVLSAPSFAQTVIAVQPVDSVRIASGHTTAAGAQTGAGMGARPDTMMGPEIKVHQSSTGTAYISGGASVDVRDAMEKRRSEFPLKVSVSECTGAYIVADQLTLSGPKGEFLTASDVGPIVMTKPPMSGKVTAKATYKGQTKSRSFNASGKQTVNICFTQKS